MMLLGPYLGLLCKVENLVNQKVANALNVEETTSKGLPKETTIVMKTQSQCV